jgi:hypothetical protein
MTDSITNKHGTVIRVGQVWADADPRMEGRTIRIDDFESVYRRFEYPVRRAVCTVLTGPGGEPVKRPREVRIKADRLHPTSTGYRLLSDPTDTPAAAFKREFHGWNRCTCGSADCDHN